MENTLGNSYIEYLVEDKYHKLDRYQYRIINTNPEDILKVFRSKDTVEAQQRMIRSWGYSIMDYQLIAFRIIEDINVPDKDYCDIPYIYFGSRVAEYEVPESKKKYWPKIPIDYYAKIGIYKDYYPMRQSDVTYEEYIASIEKEIQGKSK